MPPHASTCWENMKKCADSWESMKKWVRSWENVKKCAKSSKSSLVVQNWCVVKNSVACF